MDEPPASSFRQKLRDMRQRSAANSAAAIAAIQERSETKLNELEVQQEKIESLTSQNAALEKQVTVSIFLKWTSFNYCKIILSSSNP